MLQKLGAMWHEQGAGTRCCSESRRDKTIVISFPAACGFELKLVTQTSPLHLCLLALKDAHCCHWMHSAMPTWCDGSLAAGSEAKPSLLYSQRAHRPFPDPFFYGCICHITEGMTLSQGEANTKLDNFCETFYRNEDLGWSDITTRIHKA